MDPPLSFPRDPFTITIPFPKRDEPEDFRIYKYNTGEEPYKPREPVLFPKSWYDYYEERLWKESFIDAVPSSPSDRYASHIVLPCQICKTSTHHICIGEGKSFEVICQKCYLTRPAPTSRL